MPNELKPCPFCGGEAEVRFVSGVLPHILKKYHGRFVFAGCRKCGIVTAIYNANNNTRSPLLNEANIKKAKTKAIEAWNRRAATTIRPKEVSDNGMERWVCDCGNLMYKKQKYCDECGLKFNWEG